MDQRIAFVTGATGFVGTNLVAELLQQGWQVAALVRDRQRLGYLSRFDVQLALGDLQNVALLQRLIPQSCDAVFHVAGDTSLWPPHRSRQYQTNVLGTRNIVAASLHQQVKRFIHTSSIAAFGERDDVVNEHSTPQGEASSIHYYQTKALAEREVRTGIANGLPAVLMNPCHILGPYDANNWARLFRLLAAQKLPGIPSGSGMFSDVREVVRAHIAAVDHGRIGVNYFLGGDELPFLKLMQMAATQLNVPCPEKPIPGWILYAVGAMKELLATVTRNEPDITREGARIVSSHVSCDSNPAKAELDYCPTPASQLIRDTLIWLRQENLLP